MKNFARFLVENGLVFEINRKVLHPLGLALIVDVDRNNRKMLSLDIVETDDEAGYLYDSEAYLVGSEKYNSFLENQAKERLDIRKEKYGFIEQDKVV